MVENVHALTARSGTWQDTTNWVDKFWANYFEVGTVTKAYRAIDNYTAVRLRRWLYGSIKIQLAQGATADTQVPIIAPPEPSKARHETRQEPGSVARDRAAGIQLASHWECAMGLGSARPHSSLRAVTAALMDGAMAVKVRRTQRRRSRRIVPAMVRDFGCGSRKPENSAIPLHRQLLPQPLR